MKLYEYPGLESHALPSKVVQLALIGGLIWSHFIMWSYLIKKKVIAKQEGLLLDLGLEISNISVYFLKKCIYLDFFSYYIIKFTLLLSKVFIVKTSF